jgi:sigma-B regulation protein RsbU (phosphoserine phosphatase)
LDHLSKHQQRALEQDLDMASKIQRALLPNNNFVSNEWEIYFHYEPAGMVSGDYCDIIKPNNQQDDNLIVTIGDVSGKGVAASMLMTHMHALFHSMTDLELSVNELVRRANRLFCESTAFTHYATLTVSKLYPNGKIEICNAGHCFPMVLGHETSHSIEATGMPIGIFNEGEYFSKEITLLPGEMLLLYTDGLNEARKDEEEFGIDRLTELARRMINKSAKEAVELIIESLKNFLSGTAKLDDLTIMAVKRR